MQIIIVTNTNPSTSELTSVAQSIQLNFISRGNPPDARKRFIVIILRNASQKCPHKIVAKKYKQLFTTEEFDNLDNFFKNF